MKNTIKFLIISIVLLSVLESFGQTLNYKDLGTEKPKGNFNQYISKDGAIYKEGDTIIVGKGSDANGSFVYVTGLSPSFESYKPSASIYNTKAIISQITVKGDKKAGWKALFFTKSSFRQNALMFFIEDAVANGEIKSFGMTSDEALAELRKCKDKLDLGVITQEEFDKKKAELMKYIK